MSMWEGFDPEAWAKRSDGYRRPWWQRLHVYLTGNDPWDKPPSGGSGGGRLSETSQLAIRTAVLGGGS